MKILIIVLSFLLCQWASAAAKTWTGNTSTNWTTATNWSGNSLPASGDDVTIPTNPAGGRMPTISADYTIKSITIQTGATLTHTGGVLLVKGGDFVVSGAYNLSSGTFLSDRNLTVNHGGTVTQTGGTIHMASAIGTNPTDHIIIAASSFFDLSNGTVNTKDLTTTDGTFTQTGGTFRLYRDFKNNGSFLQTGGTIEFAGDGGGATFPSSVTSSNTQFNHVIINSGVDPSFAGNAAISFNVSGDWINNSSSVDLDSKATTVIFNGTGDQEIGGSQVTTFRNLTIDKPSGTTTLSVDKSIKNGNLTITNGILDLGTFMLNRTASGGSLTVSNGCTLKLASNTGGQAGSNFPLNFSTISLGASSTVEYDGLNSITQTIYAGATYGHLTLTNGSGTGSATKTTSANITVNGNLTLNSLSVLNPGAAFTVGGSGTLTGSGTAKVTRTAATADFNTQYPISSKVLSSMTVDYAASAAQTVTAQNYYHLIFSGSRTTNSITLANSGTIGISGTFTPSASFTSGNYILTGSTVNFNGSGAQDIPAFTFNNLTVSNSPKTATGVVNVNAAFTLNSSVLTTTAANLLVLKDNATATGASFTAYVNGPVQKVGNDAFSFPVGISESGHMPISISAPSLVTDAFTAAYIRSSATALGSISSPGLIRVSNCNYWDLDRTSGSSSVNVTLSWNGYSNCNIAAYINDLASLTVAHFNGTTWDSHGKNSSTGTVSSGTITRNNVTDFSPFSLGTTDEYANPLRVNFGSITASRQPSGIRVDWINLAETDMAFYEIERSVSNGSFTKAGKVTARVNGGDKASYDWLDKSPVSGIVLYRIKATGKDGKFIYSQTVSIDAVQQESLQIYPNPVEGGQLNLVTRHLQPGVYGVNVYDMSGRQVTSQTFVKMERAVSNQLITLPSGLQPGVYSLQVTGGSVKQVKPFIIR
jgi:hypothetical protein